MVISVVHQIIVSTLLLLLLVVVGTLVVRPCNATKNASKHISAIQPGDFIVGVLVSVHLQPQLGLRKVGQCGTIREHYGIQRSEVVFQTVDEINADPHLLPNISLGYHILDTCWYAPIALRQTIELIRGSISAKDEKCNVSLAAAAAQNLTHKNTLIGIIGPGSSSIALQVQNLLQLFNIPQIGYSTTSRDLSDKSRYNTFLRVVPSDYYQAQVMIDIVRRFNWTYVSVVNTDENYGQSGMQAFRELAERYDVCIAREDSVLSNADKSQFDEVLLNLEYDKLANVVVCFCEGMTVRGLLAAMHRLNLSDRFLFIGTDGWADRADVVSGYEREALGSITVRIHSPYVHSFDKHYFALNPFANKRNPWFQEFWEHRFMCEMPAKAANTSITHFFTKKVCTGEEKLSDKYKQEPKLSFVIKAIKTIAIGLHQMQQDMCGNSTEVCAAMHPFNGTLFFNYLLNVSFPYGPDGDTVEFDARGDPPGRYDIMNYQQIDNASFDYVKIGDWINGTLEFTGDLQELDAGPIESVCSKPCPVGSYKSLQSGGQEKKCCWVCLPCDRHQILLNETYCGDCSAGFWPNRRKTRCDPIKIEHIEWHHSESVISIVFSISGIIMTTITLIIFMRHNDTPVVKSSTRELCYIILLGMLISHGSVFVILTKPHRESCALSRILPGVSFSMIYAALFVKTNRIARILAGSKKRFPTKRFRFMSATAQLFITGMLIMIEVIITLIMLTLEPPGIAHQYPTRRRVVLACNTTPRGVLSPLGFDFLMIIFCTLYAWKTRSVPENFNEAKFIGFAMYTTCVIWVAFLPIYFGSESKIITHCICISLSATVTLMLLFFPKLYIILIRPERNIRALFTTTNIRCHIGTQKVASVQSKLPSSFSSGNTEWCCECSNKRPSIEKIRQLKQSTAIQTSLDNLKESLTYKESTCSDDTIIDSLLDVKQTLKKQPESIKTVSSLVTNLEPLIARYKPSPIRHHLSNAPRIRFNDTDQYFVPSSIPTTTSVSQASSIDALHNKINVNYNYYTSGNDDDDCGYRYLCNECALRAQSEDSLADRLRTTISEESLSGCSISEGGDYKIKSVTIRIGKPYYF